MPKDEGTMLYVTRSSSKILFALDIFRVMFSRVDIVLTNSVNNLMDHNLAELKLFMLFTVTDVLSDHGNTIFVVAEALAAAVESPAFIIVIIIQCADPGALSDSTIS